MQIKDVLATVESEFRAVDLLIHDQLASRVPLVEKIADYIVSSGGKRIRPLLVLLSAKAFGRADADAVKLATPLPGESPKSVMPLSVQRQLPCWLSFRFHNWEKGRANSSNHCRLQ